MATQQDTSRLPAEAKQLERGIHTWRATRRSGAPMPAELWEEATGLARKHGIYIIARGLRLDYGALKKRVDDCPTGDAAESVGRAAFVELDAAQLLRATDGTGPVVELARPDGARMVVRLPGGASLDVASLAAAFCGGGA